MFRYQPSSATNISIKDIISSRYFNSDGESNFIKQMKRNIDCQYFITHTSFMRSILSCLNYIKSHNLQKNTVLLPRYSCMTFAHAIKQAGLKIKYCDQDINNLNINLKSLEKEYDSTVLAIISVNLLGLTNQMNVLKSFCDSRNIFLIEDLGYSFGSKYHGKALGNFGDFSVFNFKEGKSLPISGGMVATNNRDFSVSQKKPIS